MIVGWSVNSLHIILDIENLSALAKMALFGASFAIFVPVVHRMLLPKSLSELLEILPGARRFRRILMYKIEA